MEAAQSKLVTCACIMCNGHVQFEPQHAGLRINCRTAGWKLCFIFLRTSRRASRLRRRRKRAGVRSGRVRGGLRLILGRESRCGAGRPRSAKFSPFPLPRIDIAGFVGTLCLG